VLYLNGTDHITLKHITFKNQGTTYGRKIVLSGVLDSVTIDSSKFLGIQVWGTYYTSIYGSGADATGLKIKNSTFTDAGYYAIYLNSNNSSSPPTGLEISNNTFTDTYGGIYARYYDALTIRGNSIVGSYMLDSGIYLEYCDGANVIADNHINAPDMSYGIYLSYCYGTSGNEATIVNNLINAEDYGIYLANYTLYHNIYYNTIKVRDSYALYTYYSNNYNTLKNNILLTESTSSPAVYFYYTNSFDSSDYNDFYSNYAYPIFCANYSGNISLEQWQTGSSGDSNSVSIDPIFDADSTLLPQVLFFDNLGTPISGITDDMNGTTRSTTTPDMGAIEFTLTGTPLSGSYTVGTGGDYDSLTHVLDDLEMLGLSGSLTLNVLPGTYEEQVTIGAIYGGSADNIITLQSSTGNAADVIWQSTRTSSANYILKINGTDYSLLRHRPTVRHWKSQGKLTACALKEMYLTVIVIMVTVQIITW